MAIETGVATREEQAHHQAEVPDKEGPPEEQPLEWRYLENINEDR